MSLQSRPEMDNALLWLDLEHTGLEPRGTTADQPLNKLTEVAAVVTDFQLNELVSYETFVEQDPHEIAQLLASNPWWDDRPQHAALMIRGVKTGKPLQAVDQDLAEIVQTYFSQPAHLAGNTIYQDRKWVACDLPELEKLLHYRMVDVSGFKVILKGMLRQEFPKQENHRAMSDIRESIDELRFFMRTVGHAGIRSLLEGS